MFETYVHFLFSYGMAISECLIKYIQIVPLPKCIVIKQVKCIFIP